LDEVTKFSEHAVDAAQINTFTPISRLDA